VRTCAALRFSGLDMGSDPATWRFWLEPIPNFLFEAVELFDFERDAWWRIDFAELACRNGIAGSAAMRVSPAGSLSPKEPSI